MISKSVVFVVVEIAGENSNWLQLLLFLSQHDLVYDQLVVLLDGLICGPLTLHQQ